VKTEVEQLRRELARARTADPDLLARTLQLVSRADASGDTCGPATPQDRALVRVARRHQGGAS
jgi:hypothetical protein